MPQYTFARLQGEYARLFAQMTVTRVAAANAQAKRIIAQKARYQAVEQTTGAPWFVIGCLHMREADGRFDAWLHNGDPMRRNGVPVRTVHVPKGRPPDPNVTWEDGAYDALVTCEHLDEIATWSPERVAYAAETFNGFGYRAPARNIPSPYLWGGTSVQKPGKFVGDGVYDAHTLDPQIGVMAVLRALMNLDPEVSFSAPAPAPKPAPAPEPVETEPAPVPSSPRADDTERNVKPVSHSKTIWGGLFGWLSTGGAALVAALNEANPYLLGAIVLVGAIAAVLVIKGRLDVQGLVKHLSQDDTGQASSKEPA